MPDHTPVTTTSISIRTDRLLDRFLRYVRVDTTADPDSTVYPSSDGQLELGRILRDELVAMGAEDVYQDENGLVWATVPATVPGKIPAIALVAHLDTSPEASGRNVKPQVIECYQGGDLTLASGEIIRVDSVEGMEGLVGKTLITTDGSTLLGGDDKAGVAIIMEIAETLLEHPEIEHGPVKILMTCDEEIGHGTDKIDLHRLGATVAYTIDGGGSGVIDVETFSADGAVVRFTGRNIHPSIGKGRMVNALRAAADFVSQLPRDRQTPETTEDREGFIHPYDLSGGVGQATIKLILRSFESQDLNRFADQIDALATQIADQTPGLSVEVSIARQYRNLREGLARLPEAVSLAEEAFANLKRPCTRMIVRGGTDGSQLTEKGLPTPNLASGQYNIHSTGEFACLDDMTQACEHLLELVSLWGCERT
jgi:tripeptide aminopeptidase